MVAEVRSGFGGDSEAGQFLFLCGVLVIIVVAVVVSRCTSWSCGGERGFVPKAAIVELFNRQQRTHENSRDLPFCEP